MFGFSERDSYTQTRLSAAMSGAAAELKRRIQSATGLTYFVHPVVVVWGDFEAGEGRHGGVDYISGAGLEDWLRKQRTRLSPRDAEFIRLGLESEDIVPRAKPLLPRTTA
jgi:hypothetical protein